PARRDRQYRLVRAGRLVARARTSHHRDHLGGDDHRPALCLGASQACRHRAVADRQDHRAGVTGRSNVALFLVISNPRPERPSEMASRRQSFWPWIGQYEKAGVCKHIYARVGRGAVAVFDVESNEALHRILNEWADIIPAEFEVY